MRVVCHSRCCSNYPASRRSKQILRECRPDIGAHRRLATADSDCSRRLLLSGMAAASPSPEQSCIFSVFEPRLWACIGGRLVWLFAPSYVTSPRQTRQRVLRQDLLTMRAIIGQYTLDRQKPPHSLDDLVLAGYLKKVPMDPMTGRNDTWVVKCSSDRSAPGIVGIESGYGKASNEVTLNCE